MKFSLPRLRNCIIVFMALTYLAGADAVQGADWQSAGRSLAATQAGTATFYQMASDLLWRRIFSGAGLMTTVSRPTRTCWNHLMTRAGGSRPITAAIPSRIMAACLTARTIVRPSSATNRRTTWPAGAGPSTRGLFIR